MEAFLGGLAGGLTAWLIVGGTAVGWLLWQTRHATPHPDDPPHKVSAKVTYLDLNDLPEPTPPPDQPEPPQPPRRAPGRAT